MTVVVLDAIAAAAIDLAREAAETDAPEGTVGAHLTVVADAEGVVSHQFECLSSAYPGSCCARMGAVGRSSSPR
jgi:hypothetical protein